MTVAAVVLSSNSETALADSAGRVAVRRIVDAAWAGGAMPIIVVGDDPDDAISAVIQGSPAVSITPTSNAELGIVREGASAALAAVQDTTALLLWPVRMAWIDPETVTSLIEAHGRDAAAVVRPGRDGAAGWPVLVPADLLDGLLGEEATSLSEALDAGALAPSVLELGDPGSVLGLEVSLDDLPRYEGPAGPVGGPPPEWGAAAADEPDPETSS